MIDESLIKSNFIGRDSFRWWVGQIAPIESSGKQTKGEGWGNRYKVRILGYHPFSKEELPDEDLPFASVLLPPTSGTGSANFVTAVRLRPGDVVMGFFLDGDNAQLPIIFGAFGRTKDVSNAAASIGFAPFTGYTSKVRPPEGTLAKTETNENEKDSAKSTRNVDEKKIENLNKQKEEGQPEEISTSSTLGATLVPANDCSDNFLTEISGTLDNLFAAVESGTDFLGDVAEATAKIQKLTNGLVSNMMGKLYEKMVPELQGGLDSLYNQVYGVTLAATQNAGIAKRAGIAAQEGMIPGVKGMEGVIDCLPGKIVSGLGKTIQDLLNDALLSVANNGICVAEQFASSLLDGIINQISSTLDGVLDGLASILGPAFKVQDVLRSSSDLFKSAGAFIDCNQQNNKCAGKVLSRKSGGNAKKPFDVNGALDNVLDNLNSNSGGTPFIKPDCANVDFCGPPVVNIFGGDGIGGAGKAILGGIVRNTEGLSDVTADLSRTGSVIGVEITDPGAGYFTSPPLITFEDPCNLGYGAVGEATVDFNPDSPTYGQIVNVNILSGGENYPTSPSDDGDAINSDNVPIGVVDTIIINTGFDYEDAVVTDDNDIEYDVVIQNGRIIDAKPLNNLKVDNLPVITITSKTGRSAAIRPILGRLPLTPQGEIVQVIDCISPNINNIVGYINGKPYTGAYHIMPNGVKMTGATHSENDAIIYDTPQESFRTARTVGTAMTMTSTTPTTQAQRIGETGMTDTSGSSYTPPSSPPPSSPPSGGGGY